jgi:hypothetical protein
MVHLRGARFRSVASFAAILVSLLGLLSSGADGWSNGGYSADPENPDYGTHDWIADKALALQTVDVSHFKTTYHDSYLIGTEAPDNPEYIGDFINHHVYYYSNGAVQDDASADRAKAMYDSALSRLTAGDYEVAAYYMGAMTHYIADVGVFGHTMGAYTDWGDETHHSDYESEFESLIDSLTLPSTVTLGLSSAYDSAMDLAKTITFGSGTVKSNIWMDENYDWPDPVFEASAMESLYRSVRAVAAALNHLLSAAEPPPEEPEPAEPEPEAPDPPASLEAHADGTQIVLVWSPPASDGGSPVIEFRIYRGVEPDKLELFISVSSQTLSWRDQSVQYGVTYYYCVEARNSVGSSGLSQVASILLSDPGDSPSLFWPIVLSLVSATLGSGGVLLWRRRAKAKAR